MKLNLLVLRCKNIHTTKEFYEKLGLGFSLEKHGNGPEHYSSLDAGFVFELYPHKSGVEFQDTRIGFEVEKLGDLLKTLSLAGKREEVTDIVYIFQDPDGRKVEVTQKP